ncbi:ABC transporter permease [Flexivirga endophytica]|uniref:ABC transporter permease n=1 Tax=Flexivirga endophytica TaxID=1849103 RepID=A0A916SVC2_9MICO|nr:ABC transporter permease [Flexivirga endophytica]GGB18489.1 ABC transporter permease [Flexivirga endophytica]GHB37184.1 ABC transporter permease [Flexivirga endophytica]
MTLAETKPAPARPASDKSRRRGQKPNMTGSLRRGGLFIVSIVLGLVVWQLVASHFGPALVASPSETWQGAADLWADGTLWQSIWASSRRIFIGWALGVVVGAPLGLLMGRITIVREILDPYIEFFRFIPPIAFVTLAIIWFGIGESSKIVLIFYTSVFVVIINTISGAVSTDETKLRAAASLGASKSQILRTIVLPSAIPHIVTGARLAMGNSFLTIVSAEIVAAQEGLGALIWTSRNYGHIDWVFVGIIVLGALGFLFDRVLRVCVRPLRRYGVKV